jgi:stage V sporulation protein R
MEQDGSLRLAHNYQSDGRGLELERAHRVLEYVAKCWRRSVIMETVDANGKVRSISR